MSVNDSIGLFPDDLEGETLPFATLERNQRQVTMEREFFKLRTHYLMVILDLLILAFFITLFIPFDEEGLGYSLIVLVYITIWVVISALNRFVHAVHMIAKRRGYFQFYSSTNFVTQIPFIVWCAGMAYIGLLFVFVPAGTPLFGLYAYSYLQIFVGIQFIVITISVIWYFVICFLHNKRKALPNASQYLQSYEGNKSLGAKQAEVIRYLEEKNQLLGKEIVSLHSKLEEQKEKANSFAKSDYVHELNKKDQEILRLEAICSDYRSKLDRFEQQELDKIEDKYAENNRELTIIRGKLTEAQQQNNKLKLMYEVEKDSLEEALGEIELLRQTLANNGTLPEEKTIYD